MKKYTGLIYDKLIAARNKLTIAQQEVDKWLNAKKEREVLIRRVSKERTKRKANKPTIYLAIASENYDTFSGPGWQHSIYSKTGVFESEDKTRRLYLLVGKEVFNPEGLVLELEKNFPDLALGDINKIITNKIEWHFSEELLEVLGIIVECEDIILGSCGCSKCMSEIEYYRERFPKINMENYYSYECVHLFFWAHFGKILKYPDPRFLATNKVL